MKKILIALAIAGFTYSGAEAQTTQVCRMSPNKKAVSCYKTKYAENFKVCKNDNGYQICGETPTRANSTGSVAPVAMASTMQQQYTPMVNANTAMPVAMAPQSQSYPWGSDENINLSSASSYEGYYPGKGKIKVSYDDGSVATETRAPYLGEPSPQYDGPEKNKARNINVSNSVE